MFNTKFWGSLFMASYQRQIQIHGSGSARNEFYCASLTLFYHVTICAILTSRLDSSRAQALIFPATLRLSQGCLDKQTSLPGHQTPRFYLISWHKVRMPGPGRSGTLANQQTALHPVSCFASSDITLTYYYTVI